MHTAPSADRPLEFNDLVQWFRPAPDRENLIGLEVEYGLVRAETGQSIAYDEPLGCRALLTRLCEVMAGEPIPEGDAIVGLTLPDGSTFTLEMGDAIEYSAAPTKTLGESLELGRNRLIEVAREAEQMGIRVLTGGRLPFEDPSDIKWAPKPRTEIMREHFRGLGHGGLLGDSVMGLTLSTQISFDAVSEGDYFDKLRTLLAVSPFISALLANTPSLGDAASDDASMRMLYWRQIDPGRCQDLSARLATAGAFEELTAALAALPMIYRKAKHGYVRAPEYSFQEALKRGYEDGSMPTIVDWRAHLGQVWPAVRPRRTLETRLPDGQSWQHFETLPALYVGLIDDAEARADAWHLVGTLSPQQLDDITMGAARRGLHGLSDAGREIARALVDLAGEGLGRSEAQLLPALEPVREIIDNGRTPGDQLQDRWHTEWKQSPKRYVEAMAIPTN